MAVHLSGENVRQKRDGAGSREPAPWNDGTYAGAPAIFCIIAEVTVGMFCRIQFAIA